MNWKGKELANAGEVMDAALSAALGFPGESAVFLAGYTEYLASVGMANPLLTAVGNLTFMASREFIDSDYRVIVRAYGTTSTVLEWMRGGSPEIERDRFLA